MTVQCVWFKRDLRIDDHRPLVEAAARGPVLAVYVHEPDVLAQPETDPSHVAFINCSLEQLRAELRARGGDLVVRHGPVIEVLERLRTATGFTHLWSHEETGNRLTFDRDLAVADWARESGVDWTEIPQTGVVRRLPTRDGWARRWAARMKEPLTPPPGRIESVPDVEPGPIPDLGDLGLGPVTKTEMQPGGEDVAWETLGAFLDGRGAAYRSGMSSPVTAWSACSRLSPHLAYGTISMRRVYQETAARRAELKAMRKSGETIHPGWLKSLASFEHRLRWRDHFMQKLEDEPRIEFENMSRAYDGLREDDFDEERFAAWCAGRTGYPMVDACMRALHASGWINFRMRAMLVSFASYHLWLHWRPTGLYLARHFLDFEPGIHWSQFQMQSGTTGINALRIYSPSKQVKDHDPTGEFIRRYVPELAGVPDAYLPEPHTMPADVQSTAGCVIGTDYPAPIVDHKTAVAEAKRRIYAVRRRKETREEAQRVVAKHGSRRKAPRRRR